MTLNKTARDRRDSVWRATRRGAPFENHVSFVCLRSKMSHAQILATLSGRRQQQQQQPNNARPWAHGTLAHPPTHHHAPHPTTEPRRLHTLSPSTCAVSAHPRQIPAHPTKPRDTRHSIISVRDHFLFAPLAPSPSPHVSSLSYSHPIPSTLTTSLDISFKCRDAASGSLGSEGGAGLLRQYLDEPHLLLGAPHRLWGTAARHAKHREEAGAAACWRVRGRDVRRNGNGCGVGL